MNRTQKSFLNILTGVVGQILLIVSQFICRTVFVKVFSAEYLGINGLFSNILSLLSLAELGFGSALIYSMYTPLAKKNKAEITQLMNMYRRIYSFIAVIVAILGLMLLPFLKFLITDTQAIPNISIYYSIYLVNSVASYLLIYKRSIIDADQKGYISNIYNKIFSIGQNILQIIFLLITHDFAIYLSIQVLMTVIGNITLSRKADNMYPYLKLDRKSVPTLKKRQEIYKNTIALSFHRFGNVAVTGTDNLLMSAMISTISVGVYSNYVMITNSLSLFLSLIFNAFSASIGNLSTENNKEKMLSTYYKLIFLQFWIYSFSAISLYCLFNPFIEIWLGSNYVFNQPGIVFVIVVNFYLSGMRQVTTKFRDAMGLFWQDRYKAVFEAIINLIASILLTWKFGLIGVLIGTSVSTILVSFWVEPFILFKYGLKVSMRTYYLKYFLYMGVTFVGGLICYAICKLCPNGLTGLLFRSVIVIVVYNLFVLLIFRKNSEFKGLLLIIKQLLRKKTN